MNLADVWRAPSVPTRTGQPSGWCASAQGVSAVLLYMYGCDSRGHTTCVDRYINKHTYLAKTYITLWENTVTGFGKNISLLSHDSHDWFILLYDKDLIYERFWLFPNRMLFHDKRWKYYLWTAVYVDTCKEIYFEVQLILLAFRVRLNNCE